MVPPSQPWPMDESGPYFETVSHYATRRFGTSNEGASWDVRSPIPSKAFTLEYFLNNESKLGAASVLQPTLGQWLGAEPAIIILRDIRYCFENKTYLVGMSLEYGWQITRIGKIQQSGTRIQWTLLPVTWGQPRPQKAATRLSVSRLQCSKNSQTLIEETSKHTDTGFSEASKTCSLAPFFLRECHEAQTFPYTRCQ